MSNVVYLMSSLPSLTFGQAPPISLDEFNRDARSQLSARHFNLLDSVDIQKTDTPKGVKKSIASLLTDTRNDISEIRNARLQHRHPRLDRMPKWVAGGDPLDREKQIMQWQWEELDSIEAGKTFTLTEVMVYKLKLQILCRLDSFDDDKGAEVLASVINPSMNREDK